MGMALRCDGSLRYYRAQAFARLLSLKAGALTGDHWAGEQRAHLTADLLERQLPDGSWRNPYPESFEDEPIIATACAVRALSCVC